MIIDSKQYNGACSCGKEHCMTTSFCIVESGCLKNAGQYIQAQNLSGFSVAVYDENTYRAVEGRRPTADMEVILPAKDLHANEHGVALLMERLPDGCDYLLAVGSGTVHDITRYCAYMRKIPFVSCPTAASVDGFCSSVAAMTWQGAKKTLTAVAPTLVIADLDVIKQAPLRLTRSGFGDMIGKFVALADWKMAHELTGEYFCVPICNMTLEATKAVMDSAAGIQNGDHCAYEKLMYGLLLSGLAMQLLGNSRCASGAEHHISHLIEMQPAGLGTRSDALHGEKVGVGTLLVCEEYHRLKARKDLIWRDYPTITENEIQAVFGDALRDPILQENATDACRGITAEQIRTHWDALCQILDELPTHDELLTSYAVLGVKSTLGDIDISEEIKPQLLHASPLVRNRLTLMRLRRAIENLED